MTALMSPNVLYLMIVCIVLYYIVIYTRVFFFCIYEYNFRLHRCILYCCMLYRYFYLITLNRWTPRSILLLLKQDRPWVCDDDQIYAYKDQSTIRCVLKKRNVHFNKCIYCTDILYLKV